MLLAIRAMSPEDENTEEQIVEAEAAEPFPGEAKADDPEIDAAAAAARQQTALVQALHSYFLRHNVQALALALFSLVASAILWALVYIFVYWFSLVGATLSRSFNPATLLEIDDPDLAGRHFTLYFAGAAALLLVIAGLTRKYLRPERLLKARFYVLWIVAELLLAVPNATFAVWGNLHAITRLRRHDAVAAAQLLREIERSDGGLSLGRIGVDFDDKQALHRVLFALQLVGLVGLREKERGWFLCLEEQGMHTLMDDVRRAGA